MTKSNPILRRFASAFNLEIRLVARHWSFVVFQFLWLGILAAYLLGFGKFDGTARTLLETGLGRFTIGIGSLAALFLGGIAASRAERARCRELEDSYPTGLEVLVGRWLAGLLVLLSVLAAPLIFAAVQGPLLSFWEGAPIFILEAGVTFAFASALAWCAAAWLRLGRWSVPVLASVWLGFLLLPSRFGSDFPAFTLFNFMRQGVSYFSEVFLRLPFGVLPQYFNLFYLGLIILLLSLLALGVVVRRNHRSSILAVLVGLLGALLAGFSFSQYAANAEIAPYTYPDTNYPLERIAALGAINLNLDMSHSDQPVFTTHLTVSNPSQQPLTDFGLLLDPSFTIVSSELPAHFEGSILVFQPPVPLQPGEELSFDLVYSGPIWNLFHDDTPTASVFVHKDGVRLFYDVVWHPQGATTNTRFNAHLTVTGAEGLVFASNLPALGPNEFASENATWIFLIGSPRLVVEKNGNLTLVTGKNDLPRAREMAIQVQEQVEILRKFFPSADYRGTLLMVLSDGVGLPSNLPSSSGQVELIIGRQTLSVELDGNARPYFLNQAIVSDLLTLSGSQMESFSLFPNSIAYFTGTVADKKGDAQAVIQFIQTNSPGDFTESIPGILAQLYSEGGTEAVAQAIQKIIAHEAELTNLDETQAAAWLLEQTNAH